MKKAMCLGVAVLAIVAGLSVSARAEEQKDEYRVGGPLAGLELPLLPTQHGEPAGFPGCIPELRVKHPKSGNVSHSPGGMAPREQLYPGSIEHWHAYWYKYLPLQSMFTKQSLLKNWIASKLPGLDAKQIEQYAEPVYWLPRYRNAVNTGRTNRPVPVVRARVGAPAFQLDCGELEPGLYALRVIGAVETKYLQRHRLPLYMRMTVNDGVDGGEHSYRIRGPYVDEFYAVAEFYFHAPEKRDYKATLTVDEGTRVDLLIYNVDLHDVLAGRVMRAIKTKRTLTADVPVPTKVLPNTPERLARDGELWNAFPPINFFQSYTYGMGSNDGKSNWPRVGAGGLDPKQIAEKYGDWSWRIRGLPDEILFNKKLNLKYTMDDYRAGRPLPNPYPFKDSGAGVWTPPEKAGENPQNFWPVADGLWRRMRACSALVSQNIEKYRKGDAAAGRDAALMLCRIAYNFPTITAQNTMHAVVVQPGSWGRDHGCRRRDPARGFLAGVEINDAYDMLFDLIKTDNGLAESVGRFIPWVKTPRDVIKLMDVYLVQTTAERCLRYHTYSSNVPARILQPAICLGDKSVTNPWLDWLFSATFVYPLPPSGIQDLMVTGNDRNGMGYIGSHYYAHGEQAAPQAMAISKYIAFGGDKKYDLSDPEQYPKPLAACYWYIDSRTAGNYFPRIGDVCGPDKRYGHPLNNKNLPAQCTIGWHLSKDPKFAYYIVRNGERKGWTAEEWAELEKAAATIKRAPWWENRSRVLIKWGGFLETGVEYTDPRFRRSAMVRVGQGWGHHHDDTLDLQIYAHGYPMTIDGGQRPGYTNPGDRMTRTHNLVEVDGAGWMGHAWIRALSDVEGARYLHAEAVPPRNHPEVKLYRRQMALIDVDRGGMPEAPAPGVAIPLTVPSPNSYVFDVVRVSGGKLHTYCFHAMLEDDLTCNVADRVKLDVLTGEEKAYADRFHRNVAEFPESSKGFAGTAPQELVATWRMMRDRQGIARTEETMNQTIWDPKSPRKFTRLHLLGQKGARVMTGWSHCTQWRYGWTNLFTQRRAAADLESVFPAVIEPYVGEPFITETALLPVARNEADAQRAVAVQVTTRNGHTDLLFADGRPEKVRTIGANRLSAEFACISTDAQGLRLATLTGGTLLATPDVEIAPARRERTGTVTAVDYAKKQMVLDTAWPAAGLLGKRVMETGVPGHETTYTIAAAKAVDRGTQVTLTEGADFYLSRVQEVDSAKRIVYSALAFTESEKHPCPGIDKHWVASNDARTKFWRAEYLGDVEGMNRYAFRLDGPVTMKDFDKMRGFRLWEYGAGDRVRQSTFVSVRRVAPGVFEVTADVPVKVALRGAALQVSADGKNWKALAGTARGGKVEASLSLADLGADGKVFVKVQ